MGRMMARAVREATAVVVVLVCRWEQAMQEVEVKHPAVLVASLVVREVAVEAVEEEGQEPIVRGLSEGDVDTRRNHHDPSSIPMRMAYSTGWHSSPFGSFTICGPLSSDSPFLNCSKATISAPGIYATR